MAYTRQNIGKSLRERTYVPEGRNVRSRNRYYTISPTLSEATLKFSFPLFPTFSVPYAIKPYPANWKRDLDFVG